MAKIITTNLAHKQSTIAFAPIHWQIGLLNPCGSLGHPDHL